jgi:hypothetical protein
MNMSK